MVTYKTGQTSRLAMSFLRKGQCKSNELNATFLRAISRMICTRIKKNSTCQTAKVEKKSYDHDGKRLEGISTVGGIATVLPNLSYYTCMNCTLLVSVIQSVLLTTISVNITVVAV